MKTRGGYNAEEREKMMAVVEKRGCRGGIIIFKVGGKGSFLV